MKQKKPKNRLQTKSDYQSLKTVWYAKLKEAGFDDIEKDEHRLKQYAAKFNAVNPNIQYAWEFKQEYYSMARTFLTHYRFKSNLDKVIWEYHTGGISYRNIAKLLNKVKTLVKWNKDNVNEVVSRLEVEMKKALLPGYKE